MNPCTDRIKKNKSNKLHNQFPVEPGFRGSDSDKGFRIGSYPDRIRYRCLSFDDVLEMHLYYCMDWSFINIRPILYYLIVILGDLILHIDL